MALKKQIKRDFPVFLMADYGSQKVAGRTNLEPEFIKSH